MTTLTRLPASRSAIRDQVSRHPLIAFVCLAYAISWLSWLLADWFDLGVVNGFGIVFSAGPALAGMIVAALLRPGPSGAPAAHRWRLFAITALVTLAALAVRRLWITPAWSAFVGPVTLTAAYPSPLAFLMDVVAAASVAVCVAGVYSPRQGVRDLLRSFELRAAPVRWYWWVIAVALYPVVIALGQAVAVGLGLPVAAPKVSGLWVWLALDVLLTYLVLLFHGGGLEEPGWRGFALPLLQGRYSPLGASLILAVLWTLWHWPYFWSADLLGGLLGLVSYGLLEVVPLAILFTAIFNRTGGSLPVAILLHVSINTTAVFLTPTAIAQGLWLALCVGTALWMWRVPRAFSGGARIAGDT